MITYKVKLAKGKRADKVEADYFRVENGVLTFRIANRSTEGGYPIFVKSYAASAWLTVENMNAPKIICAFGAGDSNEEIPFN